jgi:hypothetical protein
LEIEMRQEPTATLLAKCKRAAKAAIRAGARVDGIPKGITHSQALDAQAVLAGYASWHDLQAAQEARARAAAADLNLATVVPDTLPLDPSLPAGFYDTANDERSPEELDRWWDVPYAVTQPDGTLVVRCLDGGAWDRPTFYGAAPDMVTAVALGRQKLNRWRGFRAEPMTMSFGDGLCVAVLMPQRPDELRMNLCEPMSPEAVTKWIEVYRREKGEGAIAVSAAR